MKIRHILWSLLVWINIGIHTQAQIKAPSAETLKAFAASKTYIVMEDAMFSDFNANIEEAAQRHWKITPFEIISLSQFEKQCKMPQASFLMVVMGEYTGGFAKNSIFNILTLMMGHKSGDVNKMPDILSIPLSYYDPDGDEEEYGYKLGGILEGMQYAVQNILPRKMTITNFKDVFNNYSNEVKTKELWVTKNDLASSVNTIEKIKAIYSYRVSITSEQAIQQAIDEKRNNVAFLHKVGNSDVHNATCLKVIINCADGKPLYGDYHSISAKEPNGLLPKDFKALQQ